MPLLQALVRYSITTLFLGLCLQLITGQEEYDNRKPLTVQISPIPTVKVNETSEIRCNISTELRECMAVKLYIRTNVPTRCSEFFEYNACIYPGDSPRNFYWNICSQRTVKAACVAEVINDPTICDECLSVVPARNKKTYDITTFKVNG